MQVYGPDKVATNSKARSAWIRSPRAFSVSAPSHTGIQPSREDPLKYTPTHNGYGNGDAPSIGSEDPPPGNMRRSIYVDSFVPDWIFRSRFNGHHAPPGRADNFDFTGAATDGSDLRVQNIYGENLAFTRVRYEAKLNGGAPHPHSEDIPRRDALILRYGHENAIDRSVNNIWNGILTYCGSNSSSVLISDFEKNTTGNNRVLFPADRYHTGSSPHTRRTATTPFENHFAKGVDSGRTRNLHALLPTRTSETHGP